MFYLNSLNQAFTCALLPARTSPHPPNPQIFLTLVNSYPPIKV